jgi:hypothetical protein
MLASARVEGDFLDLVSQVQILPRALLFGQNQAHDKES